MGRVLVTEEIAEAGLDRLRTAGHDVEVREGLEPAALLDALVGVDALIIRSATKVTAEVLEAGRSLVVVGRAGIGLDNVDVPAATRRGVLVVNAPQANIISAAEHTMALLLAQARNIAPAHSALVAGRWERTRWEGVELHGKILGVVGLGRVGTLVAQRAAAFGMQLLAYDPYVGAERARSLGVALAPLDEVVRRADFLTVHLPKTPETVGLLGADMLATAQPHLRIVNTARGGIIDETALAEAIAGGRLGGAALDVWAVEPTTASPLFGLDEVVVTPHLGASTREAQDKAGVSIAEQVELALAGEFVPFAVNIAATASDPVVRAFVAVAERLGRVWAALVRELPPTVDIEVHGSLAEHDTRLLTLSVLKGVWTVAGDDPVSLVNAQQLASERGLEVRSTTASGARDYVNLVTVRGGGHAVSGTVFGQGPARIVMVDDHDIELPLAESMLVVRNDDRVGMVATITAVLAEAALNIVDLKLGRTGDARTAMMAVSFDQPVPPAVIAALAATSGVLDVVALPD